VAVNFPDLQAWDGDRFAMSFPADVDGKRVVCRISVEALQDGYDPQGEPRAIFAANRGSIEVIAERLIFQNRFESDGSVLIRSSDLR
jgi:hypothetical protein